MISAILVSLNINVINAQSDKASWTKGWNNKGSVAAVGVGSSIPLYSGNPFTQWRSAFGTWRNYNGRKMDTIGCQVNYGNFLNINAGSFVIGAGPDFFLNNGAVGCGTCIEMYNPDTGRTLTGVVYDLCPSGECTNNQLDMEDHMAAYLTAGRQDNLHHLKARKVECVWDSNHLYVVRAKDGYSAKNFYLQVHVTKYPLVMVSVITPQGKTFGLKDAGGLVWAHQNWQWNSGTPGVFTVYLKGWSGNGNYMCTEDKFWWDGSSYEKIIDGAVTPRWRKC